MNEVVFTPASVLALLANIDELADYDISLTETLDGGFQLSIGDSYYTLESDNLNEIEVDQDVVQEVDIINEEVYDELGDQFDLTSYPDDESLESVESGLLKEAAKSLLLGGMIRLSAKLLKG